MKRFSTIVLILALRYVAVNRAESDFPPNSDVYSNSDDVNSLSELIKSKIFDAQDLELTFGTSGENDTAQKITNIMNKLQGSLNPVLSEINTRLAELEKGTNSDIKSMEQSVTSDMRKTAQKILDVIYKAEIEIDSETNKDDRDNDKGGDYEEGDEDGEHGEGDDGGEHGGNHKPWCKPSEIKNLIKLEVGINAKAIITYKANKILQSLIISLRKNRVRPSRDLLKYLDISYNNAWTNLNGLPTIVAQITRCPLKKELTQKLNKDFGKFQKSRQDLQESRLKEMSAEYDDYKHVKGYCKQVTAYSMINYQNSLLWNINVIQEIIENDLSASPESQKIQMKIFKKLVVLINKLLRKCGAKLGHKDEE